jgi:hypothetical protein
MNIQRFCGHRVELYDCIDELPIQRFQKYNKFLMIEAGVGSTAADIVDHITRAERLVRTDPTAALRELENVRTGIYLVREELSPPYLAFAVLVARIDGEPMTDISDDGLRATLDRLRTARVGWIDCIFDAVKKKIDTELRAYFPERFDDAAEKQFYDDLKEHTLLTLDTVATGKDHADEQAEIVARMDRRGKPQAFTGRDSAEVRYDRQFEDLCVALTEYTHGVDPHTMTVMQFYTTEAYAQRQVKEQRRRAQRTAAKAAR